MTLGYGLLLLFLGSIATVGFFAFFIWVQSPKKKPKEYNDVLRKSGFLGDDTVQVDYFQFYAIIVVMFVQLYIPHFLKTYNTPFRVRNSDRA